MALNLGVKVFLILVCFSFILSIAPNPASPLGYGYGTGWNKLLLLFNSPNSSVMAWLAIVLTVAGAIILATTSVFPNAFTLFAGVMGAFAGFVTVPWDLLTETNNLGFGSGTDVGAMIPGFFIVTLVFMIFIVVFAMFKGTDF